MHMNMCMYEFICQFGGGGQTFLDPSGGRVLNIWTCHGGVEHFFQPSP